MEPQPTGRIGPYRTLGTLGQGGMGVVYRGEHLETGAPAAIKTVRAATAALVASIRREIHALGRLRHPGVVRILEQGVSDGLPWYAMELLAGQTLRSAPPSPRESLALLRRLCRPLAFVHGHGLVHRDLKPENIFLRADGTPVLVDFGIAGGFSGAAGREALEAGGQAAGSRAYMAPEQIRAGFVDARADLYALGCIAYELLTGQPPFPGQGLDVLYQHLHERPAPPSRHADGVPPELDALVLRLLEKRPADRLGYAEDVDAALAALGVEGAPPEAPPRPYLYRPELAGRAGVMEALGATLDGAARGRGGVIHLWGESGAGKTRVALELAAEAARRGFTVVTGAAVEVGAVPLHPLRPLLLAVADACREGGAAATDRLLGPRGPVLASLESGLRELPGQAPRPEPPPLPPPAARARLLAALRDTLCAFAAERPVLLLLDDLHWADELSLELLRDLPEALAHEPVLVLGTLRTEEKGAPWEALRSAPGAIQVDLPRLSAAEVGAMVAGMLALRERPGPFVDFIARQSDGNPFFVAEYLRAAVDAGLLHRGPAREWRLADRGRLADALVEALPPPGSLAQLVRGRLEGLPEPVREVLGWAAVLGREFEGELLADAAGLDLAASLEAVEALRLRQILEEAEGGRLRFVHELLRELAYRGERWEGARAEMHRRAGELIEARYGAAPDFARFSPALAHHFLRAGARDRAGVYFLRAGDQARAASANGDALGHYEAGAECLRALSGPGGVPEAWRAALGEVEEKRGELLALVGRHEEARAAYAAALAELPGAAPVPRARLLRKAGKSWQAHHRHAEALRACADAEAALGEAPAPDDAAASGWWHEWVQVQIDRISAHYFLGQVEALPPLLERVRPAVEAHGTPYQRAQLFQSLVLTHLRRERYVTSARTVEYARACLAENERAGDEGEIASARFGLGAVLLWHEAYAEAEAILRATLEHADRAGNVLVQARCLTYLVQLSRKRGRVEEVRGWAARCREVSAAGGMADYEGAARASLGWVAYRERRRAEAERESEAALELWRPLSLVYPFQWMAHATLAALRAEDGQEARALEHARALLDPRQQRLPDALASLLSGAVEAQAEGQGALARSRLARGLGVARRLGFL